MKTEKTKVPAVARCVFHALLELEFIFMLEIMQQPTAVSRAHKTVKVNWRKKEAFRIR